MKLTTPQEKAYEALKEEIEDVKHSSSKWGIALLGPNGYGKSTVIRRVIKELTNDNLTFIHLKLNIPAVCSEGKNVNWSEFINQLKELLPDIERAIGIAEKIESFSLRMEKISSICRENKKRVFIVLDHLEECADWREARWPIEDDIADVIAVSDIDTWRKKDEERVVTSIFPKKIYLNKPLDYEKDERIFLEIINSKKFQLDNDKMSELFKSVRNRASQGRILTWWDIFREADEMER